MTPGRVFTFAIPTPPSANSLFANLPGRGRQKTREYRAWLDTAGWELKARWQAQGCPLIEKPLALTIRVGLARTSSGRKGGSYGDISNRIKAAEDLLCATIPGWPDDCWNDDVRIIRDPEINGAIVTVTSLETAGAFA